VLLERAARSRDNPQEMRTIVLRLYRSLLIVGAVALPIIMLYGDITIPWVFGPIWYEAGRYAQWIAIWLLFVLVTSPLSSLFVVLEKLGLGLPMNAIIFASRAGVIVVCAIMQMSAYDMIVVFSLVGAVVYACTCFVQLCLVRATITDILKASWPLLPILAIHCMIGIAVRGLI